jgi:segregation and condensation protein A
MAGRFVVKTEAFEGPLELLLSLIEKRKLSINVVSLSRVADDYISYVKALENFPVADSANFILIAATLLLIKSKSLLPGLELSDEEQGSIEDLERRLKIYRRMKELGRHVRERFGREILFPTEGLPIQPVFAPDKTITTASVFGAIKELLKNLPKADFIPKAVVQKVISLEETVRNLADRIGEHLKMSFREFAGVGKNQKVHVIVSFLAMLELVKQGAIKVSQDGHFSEITMETETIAVPKYGK